MERPAKRLRILQSLDVDETHPDYVHAQQKQQKRFKGRLESIFAKYENMHASMSDEIDIQANKMVVDRGHLRRLARQAHRQDMTLLNSLALGAGPELDDDTEEEKECDDSEDELAPTKPVAPRTAPQQKKRQWSAAFGDAQTPPSDSTWPAAPTTTSAPITIAPSSVPLVPQTPNPAANLLQLGQLFPQTPAGQQAQSSFYTTLAQTINSAVQQAVAPLLSGIFSNTPHIQLPLPIALPPQHTPAPASDTVAPATDPKWYFPPLTHETHEPETCNSSPIPAPNVRAPTPRATTPNEPCIPESDPLSAPDLDDAEDMRLATSSATASLQSTRRPDIQSARATRRASPRVEIEHSRRRRAPKYIFTEEDNEHIVKMRMVEKCGWTKIKNSKAKWESIAPATIQQHWRKNLEGRSLQTEDQPTTQIRKEGARHEANPNIQPSLPYLPTPSLSERDDDNAPVTGKFHGRAVIPTSSSVYYDADDCDLLSLPGTDLVEDHSLVVNEEEEEEQEETFYPDVDDVILPSVEQTEIVDEGALQQGLLEDSTPEDVEATTRVEIKREVMASSPTRRRTQKQVSVASEMDTAAKSGSGIAQNETAPRQRSVSIDLVGDDELQHPAPVTPKIKRECSTPPRTSFLLSTPAAQSRFGANLPPSGVKTVSGLSRKAYRKQVKQSWTKKPLSATKTKTVTKRQSFPTLPTNQAWNDDGSDDELGL
ncbi:hypothetical protein ACEQ8H_000692 [Pleosporales sp. CAS-2024a]